MSTAGTRDSIDRSESIVSSSDNSSVILPAKVAATKVVTTDIQGSTDVETTAIQYVATSASYASHHTSFPASLGITMSESSSEELDALCDKCWDSRTAAKIELEVSGPIDSLSLNLFNLFILYYRINMVCSATNQLVKTSSIVEGNNFV